MTIQLNKLAMALASAALLTLAGCGGGDGDSGSAGGGSTGGGTGGGTVVPPVVSKTNVAVTVVDGAIQNAQVCLDLNSNGSCDANEPSGKTDASGKVVLAVPDADVGKFPIIANVGTDAVDADNGPVTVAYTLKAPADRTAVVSPLTTLVQAYLETSGGNSTDAGALLQAQLGLSTSAFADFTKDSTDAGKLAGTVARLIVVTTQTQRTATKDAKGTDNQVLTSVQIDSAINARLISLLTPLVQKVLDDPTLNDPSISFAQKQEKMEAAASQIAAAAGLTKDNIGAVVATQSQAPTAGPADEKAVDTVSLRWFSFTDAQNYLLRAFKATAAQNTPDANGKTYFTEVRERKVGGTLSDWGMDLNNWGPRAQIYWTGSAWFDCPLNFANEATAVNAAGESESLYCNALKSRSKRTNVDISGRKIIDVVREIRAYPGHDSSGGLFSGWGPDPSLPAIQSALGAAVFPSGSVLGHRTVTDNGGGTYYNRTGYARVPSLEQPNNPDGSTWRNVSLDTFVNWNVGDYAGATEVHGNIANVLLNRDYVKLSGAAGYKRYMVAFEPTTSSTKKAKFFECEGDMATRPARNSTLFIDGKSTCAPILETTYKIVTQGDAKVLSFAAEPAQLSDTTSQTYRLFVERSGLAHVGFRDKPQVSNQQRLNGTAADALLAPFGLN